MSNRTKHLKAKVSRGDVPRGNESLGKDPNSKRLVPTLWREADIEVIDKAVAKLKATQNKYLDRSKFVRDAVKEKAEAAGVQFLP